jgi:hypothetical protein
MWICIKAFADVTDGGTVYFVGDEYPRNNEMSEERVKELSTGMNRLGEPLIKWVEPEPVEEVIDIPFAEDSHAEDTVPTTTQQKRKKQTKK